jgi:class 3 adenylate cyclase
MSKLVVRGMKQPDGILRADGVEELSIEMGDVMISRVTHHPGWRWSTHVKQIVGGDSCQVRHVGYCLSGRMGLRLDSGEEAVVEPGDAFSIPSGHDGWVVGDEPLETLDWVGSAQWLRPADRVRVLASLLLTDIVGSTAELERLGDRRWRELLAEHDERLRAVASAAGGRLIKSTGDGLLFVFDGAARAVRAGLRMCHSAMEVGLPIRAAVHAGEVELVEGDVRGIAVHEAARILALASAGEVIVSDVTRQLAAGAGLSFEDRGSHRLKGLAAEVSVFAAEQLG